MHAFLMACANTGGELICATRGSLNTFLAYFARFVSVVVGELNETTRRIFFSIPEGTGSVETYVLHANRSIINVVYDRCFTSSDFVHSVLSSVAFFTTVLVFFGRFLFAVNVVL